MTRVVFFLLALDVRAYRACSHTHRVCWFRRFALFSLPPPLLLFLLLQACKTLLRNPDEPVCLCVPEYLSSGCRLVVVSCSIESSVPNIRIIRGRNCASDHSFVRSGNRTEGIVLGRSHLSNQFLHRRILRQNVHELTTALGERGSK